MKQLSKTQKAKNKKLFGYENLKISAEKARDKLRELSKYMLSKDFTTRQKLDLYIKTCLEISTDGISIIKTPPIRIGGCVSTPMFNSKIAFNLYHGQEILQIWIPMDEWNDMGDDFEEVYKEYIDWKLIDRYKQCKKRK
jgi:hypothetical protein